jgi:hypothetical protein
LRKRLIEGSDEEAVAINEHLRNYIEGVRAFWRQTKTSAYQYPLSFLYHDGLPIGLRVGTTRVEWMNWMELQIKNRIPPEITDFVVSGFLMKVEIYQ